MNEEAVFKRYDVRGKYPEELNEKFAKRIGKAVGTFIQEEYPLKVVVTRDTKESSISLKESLIQGLKSTGIEILDAGVGPTDYAAFVGQKYECVSIQVTSSHMPLNFNGLKFMYPEGNGFLNEDLNEVKQLFREETFETGEGETRKIKPQEQYKKSAIEFVEKFKEKENRKVVVETMGGATSNFLPELLRETGFEVVNCAEEKKEQLYIDPPNPKPENLEHVEQRVEEENADIGLATDLDADRVAAYYQGEWITGDEIFCVFAQILESDVVASLDSSKALEDIVEKYGGNVYHTRVGDPFVSDRMLVEETEFSGEPNGHYCFSDFAGYNSGTISALLLAGLDLDRYLDRIPDYKVEKANFEVENKKDAIEKIRNYVKDEYEVISEIDGVKFSTEDGEVLIRSSGSSPIVRFKGESRNSDLKPLKKEIKQVLENE